MKRIFISLGIALVAVVTPSVDSFACTNFLVTKGATVDGSTMITYAADSHVLYGELYHTPAATHLPGEKRDIFEWDTGKHLGQIDQVEKTWEVIGNMNEHQVAIGETTYGGREELVDPKAIMDYGSLMYVALERAKTAKQAVQIMGDLVTKYGYYSSGESFSIADPNEAWFMEMIGKGPKDKGAVWVARRLPDGTIAAHANQARIRRFPLNDKRNCLYAKDVISFARKMGFFKGKDSEFSFADAYAPMTFKALRVCETRVWSMFRRAAPSLKLSTDFVKGVPGAKPLPLWIRPDRKLGVRDVMEFMRDHFEGSEFDLSEGVGAGPYALPYRWRPLYWKSEGKEYLNERATSTQQTGFSFVAQMRSWLPDPLGGILWFGVDDTYSTVYVPMYCGIRKVPKAYAVGTGDFQTFTWDSAFWVFNWMSNFVYLRYADMIRDVQKVQRQLEGNFVAMQPEVDKAAMNLYGRAPEMARAYLTKVSSRRARKTVDRIRKLSQDLLLKYMDGNLRDSTGKVTHPGYPESWYRRVVKEKGQQFQIRRLPGEPAEKPKKECACPENSH